MLTREKAERMVDAASFADAAKMLADSGYADMSEMNPKEIDAALAEHRAALFDELARLSPDSELVDVFRIKYDYHNAKTVIKSEASNLERTDLLSKSGRVSPEAMVKCFVEENFRFMPETLAAAIVEAKGTLARTANPQLADFILDKAYFAELLKSAQQLESPYLKGYAQTMIDGANLRSAVRTMRMNKDSDFLNLALVNGGTIDKDRVIAAAGSAEGLAALYAGTVYANAATLGAEAVSGGRMTDFELACDNAVTAYLKKAKLVAFGEEPVIAYLAAVEAEITAIRMILTGFAAGIAPDTIRERLREFYA